MGGLDKGLVELHGRPMAAWVLERFAPQVDEVLINANRNTDRYAAFGHPVFGDEIQGFAGPLAGLHAALSRATHPLVVTAPCDSPFLPTDLVDRLLHGLTTTGADLAVAKTFDRTHPVFCLCHRTLLPQLAAFLAAGNRKVGQWHDTLKVVDVSFDDEAEAFRNINRPEDLKQESPAR